MVRSVFNDRFIIKGYQFHLGQSWWRKIQQLGLSTEYKDVNSEIGALLKNFFCLAFLDPVDVVKCFVEDFKTIQPEDERVQEFCEYIWNTYVARDSNSLLIFGANFVRQQRVQQTVVNLTIQN